VDIRVRAGERIAAMLAAATRTRLGPRAEQALSQPEREALLADAEGTLKQKGAGERTAPDGILESPAKRLVAVKWKERHEAKVRSHDPFRRVPHPPTGGHGS
jgi:hypothetical protein